MPSIGTRTTTGTKHATNTKAEGLEGRGGSLQVKLVAREAAGVSPPVVHDRARLHEEMPMRLIAVVVAFAFWSCL